MEGQQLAALALLQSTRKKDDDATMTVVLNDHNQIQEILMETTEDLTHLEPWPARLDRWCGTCCDAWLNSNLLHDEMHTPPPTAHIRVMRHVFVANLCFVGAALAVGMAIYYWLLSHLALVVAICVSSISFSALYVALVSQRSRVPYGWFEGGCVAATLMGGVMVGCTAALVHNVAPFEWLATMWAQSAVVVMYTLRVPRTEAADLVTLDLLMLGATLCVWALAIVAAVGAHDWVASGIVLALSLCTLVYQSAWVKRATFHKWGVSWRDLTTATLDFYGMLLILVHHAITHTDH